MTFMVNVCDFDAASDVMKTRPQLMESPYKAVKKGYGLRSSCPSKSLCVYRSPKGSLCRDLKSRTKRMHARPTAPEIGRE